MKNELLPFYLFAISYISISIYLLYLFFKVKGKKVKDINWNRKMGKRGVGRINFQLPIEK